MGGFSEEERKWIVLNFREDIGVTQLRRSFMTKMRPKSPRTKPSLQCFKKILEKFKETGRETLLAVADNYYKQSKLCLEEKGGHFEHKLKKIKK